MRRANEKGFDKFTDIGKNAWDILCVASSLPDDVRAYILSHVESTETGRTKIKTIGKMLYEKITLEGVVTIVLRTIIRVRNALIADAYPYIGKLDIDKISGKRVLDAVRKVEARGALEMASRVLEAVGMVFRYAVGTGYVQSDVTQGLRQFLQDRPPVEHHPHVCAETLPSLLKRVDQYHGRPETRLAIKLMMRTFPRTNELRWAEWTEIDFENQIWSIPSSRMKGSVIEKQSGNPHIVPLSSQCTRILRQLQEYTGRYNLLFPGMGKSPKIPMSAETINKALKVMGFEGRQTGHGFRGLASTIMHEQSGISSLAIEKQLAHKDRNKIRRTYNHAEYLDERRLLMQWWSDFLDSQRSRE